MISHRAYYYAVPTAAFPFSIVRFSIWILLLIINILRSYKVQSNKVSKFDQKGIHYHDGVHKNVNMCDMVVISLCSVKEEEAGVSIDYSSSIIIMMCLISNFCIKVLYSFVPITSALSSLKSIWIKKMLVKLFNLKLFQTFKVFLYRQWTLDMLKSMKEIKKYQLFTVYYSKKTISQGQVISL